MRYLFVVQGEGRGHLTQALSLASILCRQGHEVVKVLVGHTRHRQIPEFFLREIDAPVDTFEAPQFSFKAGDTHVNLVQTVVANMAPRRVEAYVRSICFIRSQILKYRPDEVVNFYEMLSGLAVKCFRLSVDMVGVGHQYLMLHRGYRQGSRRGLNGWLLRQHVRMSALGCNRLLALSFYPMAGDAARRITIVPPLLRKEVLHNKECSQENFILGYIVNNAFADQIKAWSKEHPDCELHVFWDNRDYPEMWKAERNLTFHRVNDKLFLSLMRRCKGYVTTAGFESVCEALFYNKPMMLIPAHIEQEINAADAASSDIAIVSDKFDLNRFVEHLGRSGGESFLYRKWLGMSETAFVDQLIREHHGV